VIFFCDFCYFIWRCYWHAFFFKNVPACIVVVVLNREYMFRLCSSWWWVVAFFFCGGP